MGSSRCWIGWHVAADNDLTPESSTFVVATVDAASQSALSAMAAYFAELDATFPTGFDPGPDWHNEVHTMGPPGGAFLVLLSPSGDVAACGGLQSLGDQVVEIKRMWVAPGWRGRGLGPRVLTALEQRAADLGHRRVVLDTNATLEPAIAMYRRAAYTSIDRYNDNPYAQLWFAKDLQDTAAGTP